MSSDIDYTAELEAERDALVAHLGGLYLAVTGDSRPEFNTAEEDFATLKARFASLASDRGVLGAERDRLAAELRAATEHPIDSLLAWLAYQRPKGPCRWIVEQQDRGWYDVTIEWDKDRQIHALATTLRGAITQVLDQFQARVKP